MKLLVNILFLVLVVFLSACQKNELDIYIKEEPSTSDSELGIGASEEPIEVTEPIQNVSLSVETISIQDNITVKSNILTIEIFDGLAVDGDIVSLKLNDDWVLHEYSLQKAPKVIKVKLDKGVNTLISYAHNLGSIGLNTASFYIDDGKLKQLVELQSKIGVSGAIEINY